jgi:uncharacterized lipoprotein YbaY
MPDEVTCRTAQPAVPPNAFITIPLETVTAADAGSATEILRDARLVG